MKQDFNAIAQFRITLEEFAGNMSVQGNDLVRFECVTNEPAMDDGADVASMR